MKILFLSPHFYPHIGGVETHVMELSRELIKRDYQVKVITTKHDDSLIPEEIVEGVEVVRMDPKYMSSKRSVWTWMTKRASDFDQADIVHIHDVFWWFLPEAILRQRRAYITFHGWEGEYPIPWKSKTWRFLADRMTKQSIHIGEYIQRYYPGKSSVITYGATNQKLLPQADKSRVLVLGRLSPDNDLPYVLEGLKLIKQELPQIEFTFLGDGPLAHQASELGDVLGFQPDITKHLAANQWVITSSYLSILDSLAAGRGVFSVYSNPLKADYLKLHPAAAAIYIASSPAELAANFIGAFREQAAHSLVINLAAKWAQSQTWSKLADVYEGVWRDSNYRYQMEKLKLDGLLDLNTQLHK